MKILKKSHEKHTDIVVGREIANVILTIKAKTAIYINKKAAGLSAISILLLLIIYCVSIGSYCLYLILSVV
jgi:hypothetical protein